MYSYRSIKFHFLWNCNERFGDNNSKDGSSKFIASKSGFISNEHEVELFDSEIFTIPKLFRDNHHVTTETYLNLEDGSQVLNSGLFEATETYAVKTIINGSTILRAS